jgi:hypothetical protein
MPPNADAQMPKLELNDQMVTDDDHIGVIDLASRVAYEDQETSKFKLQMRLDSLGAYYHPMYGVYLLTSSTEDALLKPTDARVTDGSSLYTANENSIKTAAAIAPAVASTIDAKAIEDDIKTFAESSKVLMKALNEISQIHPFIAGNYRGTLYFPKNPRLTCHLYSYCSGLQGCDNFGAQTS